MIELLDLIKIKKEVSLIRSSPSKEKDLFPTSINKLSF